jgi:hypothetical protein
VLELQEGLKGSSKFSKMLLKLSCGPLLPVKPIYEKNNYLQRVAKKTSLALNDFLFHFPNHPT